jgi:DNA-binding NarL/FixJ family response regulator
MSSSGGFAMKVLLIDDHPLILTALQAVIVGLGQDIQVAGAESAARARQCLMQSPDFDLTLLDLVLGDADGFDLLAELRRDHPHVPVVVVSASQHPGDVVRALDLGAMGFVPKRASNQVLVEALRRVLSGGIFIPETLGGTPWGEEGGAVAAGASDPLPPLGRLALTARQKDVLRAVLKGLPNKLIARELHLSVETVKDHVTALLRIFNVASRTQLVVAIGRLSAAGAAPLSWRAGSSL